MIWFRECRISRGEDWEITCCLSSSNCRTLSSSSLRHAMNLLSLSLTTLASSCCVAVCAAWESLYLPWIVWKACFSVSKFIRSSSFSSLQESSAVSGGGKHGNMNCYEASHAVE